MGVWLTTQFKLQVNEVGTAMLILGLGNLTGNIVGPRLVKKLGYMYSFYVGIFVLAGLYVILPYLKHILLVELFFFILFLLQEFYLYS
ncbi:multidrug transporter [Bacillus pseudomycoides]|uniref:Multidrug transporter n=1 Tax=Bacillus pseudomycoides TaxID=64104 RepID=A0AAJ1YYU3_9BACI|nr:multidrug transporter [Bacillus pseudomycoides]PFZ92405.1 multidrug transporter [Bacillus pseudomycoides]PHD19527.1 multidrug transporter [Bacillus pseudomycoides]